VPPFEGVFIGALVLARHKPYNLRGDLSASPNRRRGWQRSSHRRSLPRSIEFSRPNPGSENAAAGQT
jgi:hypothetical protein